jgi:hypothetical protein
MKGKVSLFIHVSVANFSWSLGTVFVVTKMFSWEAVDRLVANYYRGTVIVNINARFRVILGHAKSV